MDPLLAAAVEKLRIGDRPRPLTPHHTSAWRTADWKIRTVETRADSAPLMHELRALALMGLAGLSSVVVDHGHVGEGTWTAIGWQEGTTLWDWCRPAREAPPARRVRPPTHAVRLTADLAHRAFDRLDRLHAAGWRHGDLHPGNVLVTDTGEIAFIDHDLSRHCDLLALPYPYRGGVDHTTAPEIARRLVETAPEVSVELTDAAETYSLGASIRWAWTGANPATTRASGPDVDPADILGDIATGRRRATLGDTRPWADPDLEALIEEAMSLDPAKRTRTLAPGPRPGR